VAAVRRSYRLQCAADGVLYQLALCHAARDLGLDVHQCRRDHEIAEAAARLGVRAVEIESFVSGAGRPPGPPWTQEHRRAFAAGIAALAAPAHRRLTIRQRR
jgi:sugar phosphate isomerase/epimerase